MPNDPGNDAQSAHESIGSRASRLRRRFALPNTWAKFQALAARELNFYRVHLLAFTFIPLILSGIFYAVSTDYKISYIDCLFLCVTSMTINGLATVDLSTLSILQQVMMFLQMLIGSFASLHPTHWVFVSIVMVVVRQYFFRERFKHVILEQQREARLQRSLSRSGHTRTQPLGAIRRRFSTIIRPTPTTQPQDPGQPPPQTDAQNAEPKPDPADPSDHSLATSSAADLHNRAPTPKSRDYKGEKPREKDKEKHKKKKGIDKNSIVRVGGGGMGMLNPMGWYDDRATPATSPASTPRLVATDHAGSGTADPAPESKATSRASALGLSIMGDVTDGNARHDGDDPDQVFTDSPPPLEHSQLPSPTAQYAGGRLTEEHFPRTRTIAFNDNEEDGLEHEYQSRAYTTARDQGLPRSATVRSTDMHRNPTTATTSVFPRTYSVRPTTQRPDTKLSGFGGFPTPLEILRMALERFFPKASMTLSRTMTMPRTNSIAGRGTMSIGTMDDGRTQTKEAPYISFQAIVGRNSKFHDLTEEQIDELGGVEYRGLRLLLIVVSAYFVLLQLAGFVIVAPYIAQGGRYNDDVFDAQHKHVSPTWFSLFNVVSAFTNTGTSLSDTSLVPFQTAYLMNFIMMFLIYAGNTAFPILLRLTVWTIYKTCPQTSRLRETLKFLLDHPRRCFVYMFPSTQTWFLLCLVVGLTMIDWVCFLILDIGTPAIEAIPVGTRIAAAFVQSSAVRAAGFGIVPLASLAPAVKVLYVVMMYISIYPIALSVRSTNVYEERSLGLFEEADPNDDSEPTSEKGAQAVAKYVGWHARRQLAFDIWWLAFALWLVCIIEKSRLDDADNATWFNVFNIIFELVSAYGTVGLSLGSPIANYSFVGTWSTLSKLVVIAVMIRGRHRGLPVAIDRAVMLPRDFTLTEETALEEERSRRLSRTGSNLAADTDFFRSHSRRTSLDTRRSASANVHPPEYPARPVTPPNQHQHHMRSSFSTARTQTQQSTSPRALSFSLPQKPSVDRSPVMAQKASLAPGSLTPVKESALSRNPSRADGERAQDLKTE